MFELILVAVGVTLLFYLWEQWRPKGYPPGAWGLPVLGHLHLLGEQPQQTLMQWKNIYGPIFTCDLGSFKGIVLTDPAHIKEALNDNRFNGRPKLRAFSDRSGGTGTRGIIFTEGPEWVEQRRFAIRHLRDFGFGKKTQESLIMDEVIELIEKLKTEAGHPISTRVRFNTAITNALWTMLAGIRQPQDDPEVQQLVKLMTESMADPSPAALFMPWLTRLAPEWSGWNDFMADILPCHKFLGKYIQEHKKSIVSGSPRDFIDAYLDEIGATEDKNSSFFGKAGDLSMRVVLLDLFFASNETTSHTLAWAILYLSLGKHLKIQEQIQAELDSVVGNSRMPSLEDRPKLPYLEATLLETMRYSSVIPLGVWHNTTQPIENFHGFYIPKDTMIIPLLYGVHHDPLIWDQPDQFRPQRFLSSDGKSVVKPSDAFMPFSVGKRICIGESLAKDELFLMISAILQIFSIRTDPADPEPSLDPIPGPISSPRPHKIIFELR